MTIGRGIEAFKSLNHADGHSFCPHAEASYWNRWDRGVKLITILASSVPVLKTVRVTNSVFVRVTNSEVVRVTHLN
jgi:hypothetical protein